MQFRERINRNVYQSTTASPHVKSNQANIDEEIYDEIAEVDGKTDDVVHAVNTTIPNTYQRLVVGVRGSRPVSMYPSDIDTPRFTPHEEAGYDKETNIADDYITTNEATGYGDYITPS